MLNKAIKNLEDKMGAAEYEQRVPEKVRTDNTKKVGDYKVCRRMFVSLHTAAALHTD